MSVVIMAQVEQIFSLIKYKNEGTRTIHGFAQVSVVIDCFMY